MPRGSRITVEEKGQRAVRSLEPYLPEKGLPEGTFCRMCGIVYRNKRWQKEGTSAGVGPEVLCPACQRISGRDPAGVVTLSGPYLSAHKQEIVNTVKAQEAKHQEKNPLGRIIEIRDEGDQMTITTTEDKLAQKLGREVYKSQRGELHYKWSHDQRMVRVEWQR